jgi:hypothetical protein
MSEDRLKNPEKYYLSPVKSPSQQQQLQSSRRKRSFLSFDDGSLLSFIPKSFYLGAYDNGFSDHVNCMSGMVKHQAALSPSSSKSSGDGATHKKYLSMSKNTKYDFYCASLHCRVGPLSADESALIRLRFRLWSRNLALVGFYF